MKTPLASLLEEHAAAVARAERIRVQIETTYGPDAAATRVRRDLSGVPIDSGFYVGRRGAVWEIRADLPLDEGRYTVAAHSIGAPLRPWESRVVTWTDSARRPREELAWADPVPAPKEASA